MEPRFHLAHKLLILFGLMAPALTFVVAVSDMSMGMKTAWLASISGVYAAICGWAYYRFWDAERSSAVSTRRSAAPAEAVDPMTSLEEAGVFFGSSLNPADTFRLVSARVRDIVPNSASLLLVPNADNNQLSVKYVDGADAEPETFSEIEVGVGISGMAFLSGEIEIDGDLSIERFALGRAGFANAKASAALPLKHEGEVFGVMQLVFAEPIDRRDDLRVTMEAIAERISPLFLGARAVERSLSGALTDPLTDLPNERAFFMVLENQVAESLRFGDERPLSVLMADIKGFEEANRAFGHTTGDRVLKFAGETIRKSLRKMDFLSRAAGDEFAIVLPTAGEATAKEVIERIRSGLASAAFQVSEHETIRLWLHFGSASFPGDGETAEELVQAARTKKQESKAEAPAQLFFVDKEYVN